jgi:type VI secretion system protein ImpK
MMNPAIPRTRATGTDVALMAKTYWASADGLTLASQLGRTAAQMPVDELRRRVGSLFEEISRRFRELAIPEEDAIDVRYALAAFIDEQLFRTEWPGRQLWLNRPLQLEYFNENTAGEGFYDRLENLRRNPARVNVLQIYYLCMELGFQGKYAVHGPDGQRAIADQVRNEILRGVPLSEVVSPHAEPRDQARGLTTRERPFIAIALGILALAVLVFVVFKIVLVVNTGSVVAEMSKHQPPSSAKAQK